MRVMMMIRGDREPGHLPSEEFLAQMGKYRGAVEGRRANGSRGALLER